MVFPCFLLSFHCRGVVESSKLASAQLWSVALFSNNVFKDKLLLPLCNKVMRVRSVTFCCLLVKRSYCLDGQKLRFWSGRFLLPILRNRPYLRRTGHFWVRKVCFKKTVTHLLLYTVQMCNHFFETDFMYSKNEKNWQLDSRIGHRSIINKKDESATSKLPLFAV